jgi:hypothetical protein
MKPTWRHGSMARLSSLVDTKQKDLKLSPLPMRTHYINDAAKGSKTLAGLFEPGS